MHLKDFEQIKDKINTQYLFGSDSSLANLCEQIDISNVDAYGKKRGYGALVREYLIKVKVGY